MGTVWDISRDDRARIATCRLLTATDMFKNNHSRPIDARRRTYITSHTIHNCNFVFTFSESIWKLLHDLLKWTNIDYRTSYRRHERTFLGSSVTGQSIRTSLAWCRPTAQAIVDLLIHYNWTYIALINSEGVYSETGAKIVHRMATERGICVAMRRMIYRARRSTDFDEVARQLVANDKARAVVMFVEVKTQSQLATEIITRIAIITYATVLIYFQTRCSSPSCPPFNRVSANIL